MGDVVENLVSEILNSRGLQKPPETSRFSNFLFHLALRPYKWNDELKIFESSNNKTVTNSQIFIILTITMLAITTGFIKEQDDFEDVVLRVFMTCLLLTICYDMRFQQRTAKDFCSFVNEIMTFKQRLEAEHNLKRNHKNATKRDLRVVGTKLICKSANYFPFLVPLISIIKPDSAFNPLEIFAPFVNGIAFENSALQRIFSLGFTVVQMIVVWALWTAIAPLFQLTANARVMFAFTALNHGVELLRRYIYFLDLITNIGKFLLLLLSFLFLFFSDFEATYLNTDGKFMKKSIQLRILSQVYNNMHKSSFMNVIVMGVCLVNIAATYSIIGFGNQNIGLGIYTVFLIFAVDSLVAILTLFGEAGGIVGASANVKAKMNSYHVLMGCKLRRIKRLEITKSLSAWRGIRVEFFSSNYFDQLTPLNLILFCMQNTVNLVLLGR